MAVTYEPIASTTLGSDSDTVTFSNIPGTYTDLRLVVGDYRNSFAGTGGVGLTGFRFNSDTASNYSSTSLYGSGSAAGSERGNNAGINVSAPRASDSLGVLTADVFSYASTSVFKTVLYRATIPSAYVYASVGLWRSTSAITSFTIYTGGTTNWKSGCVFSLYGIKAA